MRGGLRANEEVYKRVNDWRERSTEKVTARKDKSGAIAQLGERLPCTQEVVGSIPSGSTKLNKKTVALSKTAKERKNPFFCCSLFFNNLEISDVLSGSTFVLTQDFFVLTRRRRNEGRSIRKYVTDRFPTATKAARKKTSQNS